MELDVVCVVLWWGRRLAGELGWEVRVEYRADASAVLSKLFFHDQCSWHGHVCVCIETRGCSQEGRLCSHSC